MIAEAEALLREAARLGRIGSLQLQAAIQSAHVAARRSGTRDALGIAQLYDALIAIAPTVGARVAHAVAQARHRGAAVGVALLDAIEAGDYQPYWSARASLLAALGREEARAAYDRAIGLSEDEAVRRWLCRQRDGANDQ